MLKKLSLIFFVLSFSLVSPGCSLIKTTTTIDVSKNSISSPWVVLERIDRNDQFNDTLKAIAHIEVNTSDGRRYPLKAAVMVKRPSSLRLEVIPFIGPPDLLLTVHNDVLKVFLPQKGEFYEGKATTKNLSYFFPFSTAGLQIDGMTSILLGTHPKIRETAITLNGSSDGSLYRIDILSEKRRIQTLWVDTETYNLVRIDLFSGDNTRLYSASFLGHTGKANVTMPQEIIVVPGGDDKQKVIIRYSDVQIETENDTDLFKIHPPPGFTPIYLD